MEIFDQTYYGNGDFDFVRDQDTKDFLKSAHNAITLCELWNWMRIYEPPPNTNWIEYKNKCAMTRLIVSIRRAHMR